MPIPVLPSKLVGERIILYFDFSPLVGFDSIVSFSLIVEVFTGVDNNPADMLSRQRQLIGNTFLQWIVRGKPGVVYKIGCHAVTSAGDILILEKLVAVLDSPILSPPPFGNSLSTTPYPVNSIEALNSSGVLERGNSLTPPLDSVDAVGTLLGGTLRVPLVPYPNWPPEAVDAVGTLTGGLLRNILISYSNWPPESIDSVGVVLNGSLVTILIRYLNWPAESVDAVGTLTGGSLV